MYVLTKWISACFLFALVGACSSLTKVNSLFPNSSWSAVYSSTSALPLSPTKRYLDRPFAFETYPLGFNETRTFQFETCPDTAEQAFRWLPTLPKIDKSQRLVSGPGTLFITGKSVEMDEVEISNKEWQHFLNCVHTDSAAVVYQTFLPSSAAQPVANYFTNPFYQHFPVVGISYEQAVGFCGWRSRVVTERYNSSHIPLSKHQRFTYRLPTEQEWEGAAGNFISREYGTPCTSRRVYVNLTAAAYLQKRARTEVPVEQIARDIAQFDAANTTLIWFNCQRELPYFLRSPTPDYTYSTVPNAFGLYHMIGNVAEFVLEKGITKGGSYRDPLEACTIASRGKYSGPAPTIGVRCACDIAFMQ